MTRALGRRMAALALAVVLASSAPLVPDSVAAAEPTFELDISWTRPGWATVLRHPSKVRVGDTMTIGFLTSGLERSGCGATIQALPSGASMGASQALADTDACEAWTFVVPPPSSIGTLYIHATAEGYRSAEDVDGVSLGPVELTLSMESGGSRQPFTTNFPHMSWSPLDFLGAATASFGTPITFSAPAGATRACRYAFSGDWGNVLEVRPLEYETCPSWNVTLPDLRPEPFRAGDLATPMGSTFATESGGYDAELGRHIGGSMLTSLDWAPTAGTGSFDTNLPAVTFPEATTPRYALVGQPVTLVPRLDSTPDGSFCRVAYTNAGEDPQDFTEIEQPVIGGACAGVTLTPTVTGEIGILTQLYRADREPLGFTQARVEVIEPMPAPTVTAPGTVIEGDPVPVSSSVGTGVPMGYSITLAPSASATADGMTALVAAATCASGSLDPRLEETAASAQCTTGGPGSYRLSVRFTDVTGVARTTTRTISVVDRVTPTFTDIESSTFRADIEWLAATGITAGCGGGRYCPDGLVTRAQMASFLARARDLPPAGRDYFTDDAGNSHESDINRLAQAGITGGCRPSQFCPSGLVTREQMASFLVRAFGLPTTSRDFFVDDADSMHQSNINRLAASRITAGCSADRYCPSGLVTRGQMAAFLHRAFTR